MPDNLHGPLVRGVSARSHWPSGAAGTDDRVQAPKSLCRANAGPRVPHEHEERADAAREEGNRISNEGRQGQTEVAPISRRPTGTDSFRLRATKRS